MPTDKVADLNPWLTKDLYLGNRKPRHLWPHARRRAGRIAALGKIRKAGRCSRHEGCIVNASVE